MHTVESYLCTSIVYAMLSVNLVVTSFLLIFSLLFNKPETFASTTSMVYHIESDLYRSDGRILFADATELKTTNGNDTTVVALGFRYATGFKQLNSCCGFL